MNDFTLNPVSKPDWQLLGKLELPIGEDPNTSLQEQLTRILDPLKLSTDFLARILNSAQDSAACILQPDIAMKHGHLHITIFVPSEPVLKGKNWGFFHIKKTDHQMDDMKESNHKVDFYLYAEGDN